MSRLIACAAATVCLFLGRPAAAETWPDDLFAANVFAAVSYAGDDGFTFGVGLRTSWTHLRAPVPMGADLEVTWDFERAALRVLPAAHVHPTSALEGSACQRTQLVRQRGRDLALGPSVAAAVGGVLEIKAAGADYGGWLGTSFSLAFGSAEARAGYLRARGLDLQLEAGLRVPSILGDDDVRVVCE